MDLLYEYWAICGCGRDKEKDRDMLRKQFEEKTVEWTSHWRALGELIKRPWFSRRWIIQENVFAQQKTIFCGKRGTCWDSLEGVAGIYHHKNCDGEKDGVHDKFVLIASLDWASAKVRNGEEHHLTLAALLARFYKSCCTNPRDAVFSLLSMARDIDREDWLLYHSTKCPDVLVFKKTFEHLVHTTQSLDVMCRSFKTPAEKVTWLPKFGQVYRCDCGRASCFKFGYRDESLTTFANEIWRYPLAVYSASGSTRPKIRFGGYGTLLFAHGYLVDTIKKIEPFPFHGGSQCRSCNRETFNHDQWMRVVCDMHLGNRNSLTLTIGFFWRSLVGNRTINNLGEGSETIGKLSDTWFSILEATGCFSHSCGCDLSGLINMEHDLELPRIKSAIIKAMNIVVSERTFAVTEYSLGFVPESAQEGDVVCILLGCSVPIILRPISTNPGYTFVGECYIHGLMEGEYMELVSKRGLEPYEIEIH